MGFLLGIIYPFFIWELLIISVIHMPHLKFYLVLRYFFNIQALHTLFLYCEVINNEIPWTNAVTYGRIMTTHKKCCQIFRCRTEYILSIWIWQATYSIGIYCGTLWFIRSLCRLFTWKSRQKIRHSFYEMFLFLNRNNKHFLDLFFLNTRPFYFFRFLMSIIIIILSRL